MPDQIQAESFWMGLAALVADSEIVIDRPKGSRHPRFPEVIYILDYGYLAGTQAGDGACIDVWLGSAGDRDVTGIVCTVDVGKRDAEIKVLLGCTPEDVTAITAFHSRGNQTAFAVPKPS